MFYKNDLEYNSDEIKSENIDTLGDDYWNGICKLLGIVSVLLIISFLIYILI